MLHLEFRLALRFILFKILKIVGAYGNEVTPVPIPNTEVKLIRVEDTWLATARKIRSVPTLKRTAKAVLFSFVGNAALGVPLIYKSKKGAQKSTFILCYGLENDRAFFGIVRSPLDKLFLADYLDEIEDNTV